MLNTILIAIPAFLFLLLTEWFVGRWRGVDVYERKDTATSLTMGTGKLILGVGVDAVLLILLVATREFGGAVFKLPTIAMDQWWHWALAVVAFDFLFYWMHRSHHVVRMGWAGHVTHHSSQRYNLATALRQSWTEHVTAIPFWLPMALIGFPAESVLITYAFSLIYQFWIHTELIDRLGPLEWFMNTPSHHRVHHGTNFDYLDRNYAGTFIIWDRLFGTFQEEKEEDPAVFGLITNIETYNPFKVAFHEWADMLRDAWRARNPFVALQVFFRPPGWQPGDDSYTIRAQRAALARGETPSLLATPPEEDLGHELSAE